MSPEAKSWGLIGAGTIGGELLQRMAEPERAASAELERSPAFVMRSSGIYNASGDQLSGSTSLREVAILPDVIFVATPSNFDGMANIDDALWRGSVVVTAEKFTVSNNFRRLQHTSHNFSRLGINATVGGGTRLLEQAATYTRDADNISEMHFALNGTLAAIFGAMAPPEGSGLALDAAVQQAVEHGFAEPGAASSLDVIRVEAEDDIPLKVAILINRLGLCAEVLDWRQVSFTLTEQDILHAVDGAAYRRFLVSVYSENSAAADRQADTIGGFDIKHDGLHIVGGFQNTYDNLLLKPFRSSGPQNGFVIGLGPENSSGVYTLTGPGAGPEPTVSTMLHDKLSLIN